MEFGPYRMFSLLMPENIMPASFADQLSAVASSTT